MTRESSNPLENFRPNVFAGSLLVSCIAPATITIKRPLEELQIEVTIQKLTANPMLSDDKFELKIPEAVTVQKLE
jgi:hypothetical protein